IKSYDTAVPPKTDPITQLIAINCTKTANILGYETKIYKNDHLHHPSASDEQTFDSIWFDGKYAVSIEEGCNGINIIILFLAFVIAYGGKLKNMLIFIPLGIIFIHIANISRLFALSILNVEFDGRAFHFFHKYAFTAIIYLAVLLLW